MLIDFCRFKGTVTNLGIYFTKEAYDFYIVGIFSYLIAIMLIVLLTWDKEYLAQPQNNQYQNLNSPIFCERCHAEINRSEINRSETHRSLYQDHLIRQYAPSRSNIYSRQLWEEYRINALELQRRAMEINLPLIISTQNIDEQENRNNNFYTKVLKNREKPKKTEEIQPPKAISSDNTFSGKNTITAFDHLEV